MRKYGLKKTSGLSDVAILMGTYEDAAYFAPQLESIIAQTYPDWKLWVSDDSQSDSMRNVLDAYCARMSGRLDVRTGPRRGLVANFLSLAVSQDIVGRYYAFADQDDVWDADKLFRGVAWLERQAPCQPALFCSRVRLIDESGRWMGLSPRFARSPTFRNALVQSLAGGNTMLFNEATRRLLVKAGADVNVVVHDWWVYLVVTACGGTVHYDASPSVSYRQHANNQIGGRRGMQKLFSGVRGLCQHRMKAWIDSNLIALERLRDELTPESRSVLERFAAYRCAGALTRYLKFRDTGIYRQQAADDFLLRFSAALGGV